MPEYIVTFAREYDRRDGKGSFISLRLVDRNNGGSIKVLSDQLETAGWQGQHVFADIRWVQERQEDGYRGPDLYRPRLQSIGLVEQIAAQLSPLERSAVA